MQEFSVSSSQHTEFITLDVELQKAVRESGVSEGVCHVFVPHTTAGVTINENADPDVKADIIRHLEKIVPWESNYAHAEGNSAAHIKASLVGFHQTVLVHGGDLVLGAWQSIYFCEFDGPRRRKVQVQVIEA